MLSFRHPRQQRRYCRSKGKLCSLKIRIRSLLNMLAFLFNLKNLKKNDCPLSILKLPTKESFRRMKNTFSSFWNSWYCFPKSVDRFNWEQNIFSLFIKLLNHKLIFFILEFQKIDFKFYRFHSKRVLGINSWRKYTLFILTKDIILK